MILALFRAGIRYAAVLPREQCFLPVLAESRIQHALDHARFVVPPLLAADLVAAYLLCHDLISLAPYALAGIFLLLSLASCYVLLGICSRKKLNPGQTSLYLRLCRENDHFPGERPEMMDLAREMREALKCGRRDFLEDI